MMDSYTNNMENALFVILSEEDDIDEKKVVEFINQPETFRTFGDGLKSIINEKYGDIDCKKTLVEMAKNEGIYLNRNTVNNWFEGNRPKKGEQSREHMFLVAFALRLNLNETKELFRKVYLDRAFNLRDSKEFIYFYCIKEGFSYNHARDMLEKLGQVNDSENEETLLTCVMEKDIEVLKKDEEILEYIRKHPYNFQICTVSAKNILEELLKVVRASSEDKEKLKLRKVDATCSYIARELDMYRYLQEEVKNKDITSISTMLTIIEGGDLVDIRNMQEKTVFRNANLPQEIRNRFPTKHTFTNENPSSEELRKMIILLYSYVLWFKIQYENECIDLEDYIERMNEILFDANLPVIYYGNPYDWLFLYCTISSAPLDVFRGIMSYAIWDR